MKFTLAFTTLLATVLAAPSKDRRDVTSTDAKSQWAIVGMTRSCDADDRVCSYSFGINRNDGSDPTPCQYLVQGTPASTTRETGVLCGPYKVTSAWDGEIFGPGKGFTTFSVIDYAAKLIAFPAYTDVALGRTGAVVAPDLSFNVQVLSI